MRKIACLSLIFSFLFSVIPVQAAEMSLPAVPEATETILQGSSRTGELVWHYRMYNGKEQKRLWSETQRKYLTDWIDC